MQIYSYNSKVVVDSDFSSTVYYVISKQKPGKLFVLVDENTQNVCYPHLYKLIRDENVFLLTIGQGESNKTMDTVQNIWSFLQQNYCQRNDLIINLGGGMLLDVGGFAASAYLRGVPFVHIPTTLLSMVDASIGGKLGCNFNGKKNQIGFFKSPEYVIVNPLFLSTLDSRQLIAGWAEMIKHGLIHSEKHLERLLGANPLSLDTQHWEEWIFDSLEIKNDFVVRDPYEAGERKVLNFGHSLGHAFESLSMERGDPLLHGEAVAAGLICELYLSSIIEGFPEKILERVVAYITDLYPLKKLGEGDEERLFYFMKYDKKNQKDQINFTLLKDMEKPLIDRFAGTTEITKSLRYYNAQLQH